MCGIFGYVGDGFTPPLLINGIRRLEYRGYDSWGIALQNESGLTLYHAAGRIADTVPDSIPQMAYMSGIAHTRWATHGAPTKENAHPHIDSIGNLAITHNGIIENYKSIRDKLIKRGHTFRSETDSEVVAHLIEQYQREGLDLRLAFIEALKSIEGTYGIAMVSRDEPGNIFLGRLSSPLVIGRGDNFSIVASDPSAIIPHSRNVVYLDDGECAIIKREGFETFRLSDETPTVKEIQELTYDIKAIEKGGFDHFMQKEIHEQPRSIQDTMRGRLRQSTGSVQLGGIDESLLMKAERIKIIACGTSWHAGLIGKYLFEMLAGIPTEVNYAAEFRYAQPSIEPNTLVIAISQSGETADTLAGIREARDRGAQLMGIVNAVGSSIARECGQGVFLHAGPEIGVASTKAFTSQVVALILLAIQASRCRGRMSLRDGLLYLDALRNLSEQVQSILDQDDRIRQIALEYKDYSNILYIGRLFEYPVALEGALKLKEISYIHAEGVPAAELKHGPIALIDKEMPVIVLALQNAVIEKMVSNINEIRARSGRILAIARAGSTNLESLAEHCIEVPGTLDPITPILGVIPLQLIAYHIAVARGCDVDKPRNLAKSVTVE